MNLKKRLPSLLLASAVIAIGLGTGSAQSNSAANAIANPFELRLEWAAKRQFKGYYAQHPGENFDTEKFYPIGWSKDGKFAYYLEPVDEACGCYFAKLFILDLKSDKVLWSFDYDSQDIDEAKKANKPYSFKTLWNAQRKLFSDKLLENGIEYQNRFTLLPFPINYQGSRLTANLEVKKKAGIDADARIYGDISQSILQLNSSRNGKKTILDHRYPKAMPLYVGVVGYVKSPFEPRIAVVLIEVHRGYEGPPNVGQVRITGASLDSGFK